MRGLRGCAFPSNASNFTKYFLFGNIGMCGQSYILNIKVFQYEKNINSWVVLRFSSEFFKLESTVFCDILNYNNKVDNSLDKNFLMKASKLIAAIQDMIQSIDEIAVIQKSSDTTLNLEQHIIINKHIMNLNVIRNMIMQIRNNEQLSNALCKIFDVYRNSIDFHYYQLHPSYESYLLQQYNVSLKESMQSAACATGSFFASTVSLVAFGHYTRSIDSSSSFLAILAAMTSSLGAYLAYCAYMKIHNPSYEFDLIPGKK